jgi:hypothetical protein
MGSVDEDLHVFLHASELEIVRQSPARQAPGTTT